MGCGNGSGKKFTLIIRVLQLNLQFYCHSLQPIQALEHSKFKELIDVASHATNGVNIPGRKGARAETVRLFKKHLTTLKAQLNVHVLLVFFSFLIIPRVQLFKAKSA